MRNNLGGVIILIIIVGVISYVAYDSYTCDDCNEKADYSTATFVVDGNPAVNITLASTAVERAKGLMNVSYMHPDQGMLFLFQTPTNTFFWMKGTLIPLDMMFVKDDVIMYIAHNATPCKVDQCPTFGPGQYYDYVVETNAGYAKQHGIDVGVEVKLD